MSDDIYSVDPGTMPWIPVIDGVAAKPLRFASGGTGWASIVRIDPGCFVPKHRHSGEVQGVVLSGRCRYTDGSPWLEPGTYLHEADGAEDEVLACPDAGAEILFMVAGPRTSVRMGRRSTSMISSPRRLRTQRSVQSAGWCRGI